MSIILQIASSRSRKWLALASVIALVPVGFAFLLYPEWYLISPAFIDNWIYWGTGESKKYTEHFFSDTYYFRRWTVIFPYLAANWLSIDGVLALAVIASLQLWSLSVASFWLLMAATKERITIAAVGTMVITANPATIVHIGNGYHTWGSLFFLVVALALAFSSRTQRVGDIFRVLAGFSAGLSMISYSLMGLYLPVLVGALVAGYLRQNHNFRRPFWISLCSLGLGFAFAVVLDLMVGLLYGQGWPDFVTYSLSVGSGLAESGDWGIDASSLFTLLLTSGFSPLPMLVLCSSGAALLWISGSRSSLVRLVPGAWVTFAAFFGMSFLGGNPLFVTHFSVVLFFVLSLLSVLMIDNVLEGIDLKNHRSLSFAGVSLVGVLLLSPVSLPSAVTWAVVLLLIVGGTLLALKKRIKDAEPVRSPLTSILILSLSLGVVFTTVSTSLTMSGGQGFILPPGFDSASNFMKQVERDVTLINEVHEETDARVWIQDNREWPGWSPVISSFYGLYSAVSVVRNPETLDCSQVKWILDRGKAAIVVFDDDNEEVLNSSRMIELFEECERVDVENLTTSLRGDVLILGVARG